MHSIELIEDLGQCTSPEGFAFQSLNYPGKIDQPWQFEATKPNLGTGGAALPTPGILVAVHLPGHLRLILKYLKATQKEASDDDLYDRQATV